MKTDKESSDEEHDNLEIGKNKEGKYHVNITNFKELYDNSDQAT